MILGLAEVYQGPGVLNLPLRCEILLALLDDGVGNQRSTTDPDILYA